jgi:peptide/nickel transport system ATP-binding protein/oligopeptide transport system ATP-binding protein
MMSLMGLLPSPPAEVVGGSILYQGREVRDMSPREMRDLRGGGIGFVFQDPMTSLNPVFTVGFQLVEPLRAHLGLSRKAARVRAAELLSLVGIPDAENRLNDYPHQFSGGMRQRVMIAMALSCDPKVLIADEPTTALDVTIQAQILEIVRELRHRLGMGIIWITHDLGLVAGIADRVMVMYAGLVVEHGPVEEIFSPPAHPYPRALLGTVPSVTGERERRLKTIDGQPPRDCSGSPGSPSRRMIRPPSGTFSGSTLLRSITAPGIVWRRALIASSTCSVLLAGIISPDAIADRSGEVVSTTNARPRARRRGASPASPAAPART